MQTDTQTSPALTAQPTADHIGEALEALTAARDARSTYLALKTMPNAAPTVIELARVHYAAAVARLRIFAQEAAEHEQVAA